MADNEIKEGNELKSSIEETIDDSVERAFKKHFKYSRAFIPILCFICLLLIIVAVGAAINWLGNVPVEEPVEPVENHDLIIENDAIFGFKVADFQEAILDAAAQQRLLIVEEKDAYVNTAITETGFLNWGIFNKEQALIIHGTGQYTIDLTQITAADISLNEETYELTIRIPHAELHQTSFDPSQTEISDVKKGWLAFGDIEMTTEQQKEFEVAARKKLEDKLDEESCIKEADRFAKLAACETYQVLVKSISPAYKVVIEFQ